MRKETGGMGTIEFLGALLDRPLAVLILRFSNNIPRLVSYDEFQARLEHRFAARHIELKKWPSELEVKAQLEFLVRQKLLKMAEGEYQITPRGVRISDDLSPRTETRSLKTPI